MSYVYDIVKFSVKFKLLVAICGYIISKRIRATLMVMYVTFVD